MVPADRTDRLTCLVALIVFAPLLAILAWSFGRGLDLTDEVSSVYLLAHPRTVSPIMDHFVWGALLSPFDWTIIWLRYLTVFALFATTALLSVAAWRFLGRRGLAQGGPLFFALPLLGALLYFSGLRPTFNYSVTLVLCANIFSVALLWAVDTRGLAGRAVALAMMGTMMAVAWLARFSITVPMIVVFVLFAGLQNGHWKTVILQALVIMGTMVAVLGALWLAGCDFAGQYLLLKAMAGVSHAPLSVIGYDVRYGLILALAGLVIATGLTIVRRTAPQVLLHVQILLLALAAGGAVIVMVLSRDFAVLPATKAFAENPAIRSLGPAIHACALALLFFQGAAWLAAGRPSLQRWIVPETDSDRAGTVLRLALLLYTVSLLPEIGTNTGLWHRSVLSMGSLFLMFALFVPRAPDRKQAWIAPLLLVLMAVPVAAVLFSNLVTRPFRVDGSNLAQTVRLDHPALLRGLKVSPPVAVLQSELDRILERLPVDRFQTPVLYGASQPGLAVLAGARILGAPWYFAGYPGWQIWDCVLARYGARNAPPTIIGMDVEQFGPGFPACLPDYVFGPPVAHAGGHSITLLRRRP